MSPKKQKIMALALSLSMVALAGCASSGEEPGGETGALQTVNKGKLTYGLAATFPPFEFKQDGKLQGFDIEMGEFLAKSMGLETESLDIDFDGLIPALIGKRIDIINSAMYINEERSAQVDFIPYLTIGETILVPVGNSSEIHSVPDDLSGKTIAVTRGAIGETYMVEFNEQLKAEGKEEMTILALPTNQDALLAVKAGRADGFDTSTPGAAYTITQDPSFEIAATFALGTQIGIAIPKGSDDLKTALEAALKEFVDSGEYLKLIQSYNLPDEAGLLLGK